MPAAFGSLYSIRILSLRSNKFNGSIPEEIIHFSKLQILDLSSNYFSGQLPRRIGNLEMLTSRPNSTLLLEYGVDVKLEMVIKGIAIQLENLYDYTSVGNMTGLESLDLSFNKLFGKIPESLASLDSLGFLNLSYNNLSGRIPRGLHLDTLSGDGSAYVNNSFLCGIPTNNICEGDQGTNTTDISSPPNDFEEDAKEKLLLCAIVAVGFVVGFWGLFFVLLLKKEKWWFPY
ncbi:receptor-like protein EIX2 [Papaver somniferum]|uniref:receptor-like protein EIX2 n=1 Tax=Papaver somniferum TaxID=3469 RepID=UPI000E6FD583|nr:receptor-like protein EIX2 [Papaver somniferum]